ncbi:MAG: hypothetical protein AAF320_05300 [Myxococcota bacterium]
MAKHPQAGLLGMLSSQTKTKRALTEKFCRCPKQGDLTCQSI